MPRVESDDFEDPDEGKGTCLSLCCEGRAGVGIGDGVLACSPDVLLATVLLAAVLLAAVFLAAVFLAVVFLAAMNALRRMCSTLLRRLP